MADDTPTAILSAEVLYKLLNSSTSEFAELEEHYALLPNTLCRRRSHCCAMLPETTLVEGLWVLKRLQQERPENRSRIIKKIVAYFFINPTQITACPFLEENSCVIYEDRFFGCRAYGLWSPQHYEQIAQQSRRAKNFLAEMWLNMGIRLPQAVIDFQLPYCRDVKTAHGARMDDTNLIQIAEKISSH
jgi:Fe-S-cluster containining protein